jgi:hypothetical protein
MDGKLALLISLIASFVIFGTVFIYLFTAPGAGQICGGISGESCPPGYTCKDTTDFSETGGTCVSLLNPVLDLVYSVFPGVRPKPAYSCPESGWVDCMPGIGSGKPQCQKAYLDWAKVNCPDFSGVAF